jgi:hypothetical protein
MIVAPVAPSIPEQAPVTTALGFVQVKNAAALEAERAAEDQRQAAPAVKLLAEFVTKCWGQAKGWKEQFATERLLACQRQVAGTYDATKAALIAAQGGSGLFFNITETKTEALEAWIRDVIMPAGDKSWSLAPSPIPDLPEAVREQVVRTVIDGLAQQILAGTATVDDVRAAGNAEYDRQMAAVVDEAKKRAGRMEQKMQDQLVEGGYYSAMSDFLADLKQYPLAVLKGPVVRSVKRLKWAKDGSPDVQREDVPTWYAVSPHDYYPGPNSRKPSEGFICEVIRLDRRELSELRDLPGYSAAAIDAVLTTGSTTGTTLNVQGDSERATLENRDSSKRTGQEDSQIEGIEFWGQVTGRQLSDWGTVEGVDDLNKVYEVCAILVGTYVIRAVLNPDPLGRRPYSVSSFIKVRGSQIGRAVPEKMQDCQDGMNATMRAVVNNIAICSLPQTALDMSVVHPSQATANVYPGKIWPYDGAKANGRTPVNMFFPPNNVAEMLRAAEYFATQADERTLIPRYSYGDQDVGGAAQTASGLSMLMSAAGRGIKRVLAYLDQDVLNDSLTRLHDWNLMYLEDDDWSPVKGDVQVVARGILAVLVKDQVQMRRQEFLNITANPIDQGIIGTRGRATILREIAKGLDLDAEKVVPSDEELQRLAQSNIAAQEQAAMASAAGPVAARAAGQKPAPLPPGGGPLPSAMGGAPA